MATFDVCLRNMATATCIFSPPMTSISRSFLGYKKVLKIQVPGMGIGILGHDSLVVCSGQYWLNERGWPTVKRTAGIREGSNLVEKIYYCFPDLCGVILLTSLQILLRYPYLCCFGEFMIQIRSVQYTLLHDNYRQYEQVPIIKYTHQL